MQAGPTISTRGTVLAHTTGDFNGDGYTDLFYAGPISPFENTPVGVHFLINSNGNFMDSTTERFHESVPTLIHAHRANVADFNGDSVPDIYISASGYDVQPFAGEKNLLLLSSGGKYNSIYLSRVGFTHGSAVADIDKDGDIDIVETDLTGPSPGNYVLVNDGSGNFTEYSNRVTGTSNLFTSVALVDVNRDDFPDLVLGGSEDIVPSVLILNDGSGSFATATDLPAISGYGVVVDIEPSDFTGDGKIDLLLSRTTGFSSPFGFYGDRRIQLLQGDGADNFTDITSTAIPEEPESSNRWIIDLKAFDYNKDGNLDFVGQYDDLSNQGYTRVIWENNGNSTFTPRSPSELCSPGFIFPVDADNDGGVDFLRTSYGFSSTSLPWTLLKDIR
ncbi:MAG: VCBS repeat-containing protein [Spirochaetota bacterium]